MTYGWPVFLSTLLVLTAIDAYLLFVNRNAPLKRKLYPWLAALGGMEMLVFLAVLGLPLPLYGVVIPAIIVIYFLSRAYVKVCPVCGRTVTRLDTIEDPIRQCPYCGAHID